MFLDPKDFRQATADTLKVNVAELGEYWDRLCEQAQQSAFRDIRGALITRGFTAAQVDTWDRGEEFERDIGLYWVLIRGAGVQRLYSSEDIAKLDRREELKTTLVEIASGAPQDPAAVPAKISGGQFVTEIDGVADRWTKDTVL